MYTRHGHHIPGSNYVPQDRPMSFRCGGLMLCDDCKTDAADWFARHQEDVKPQQDLSFLKPDERRRALALEMAMNVLKAKDLERREVVKWAQDFESFIKRGF